MTLNTTPPAQQQEQRPGREEQMSPKPEYDTQDYKAASKLQGKVALITGGDSGIGRAVAVHYAREGAQVAFVYLNEDEDAQITTNALDDIGAESLAIKGDLSEPEFCQQVVQKINEKWGKIDILVNNAGEQHPQKDITSISPSQLQQTFASNVFAMFYLTQSALKYMPEGSAIINTTSVTAYNGNPILLDYSATKGAVTAFTRSLAINLAEQNIRVNAVAPGPIWTPLIPSTFDEETVAEFGGDTPMQRPGQPAELGPAYVYLACNDSSYMTGQVLHLNGGSVVNG
ncbi:MAG: SDR family oxidoreductase [Gammaproteobacteria bacterium]|nr:SDR family oxidoreductase [Gammaproteobacteria bacterium]